MRTRATPAKAVRFEVSPELASAIKDKLGESTLTDWATRALSAGFGLPAEVIRESVPRQVRKTKRESLFLELAPAFLERLDARAVHVNLKRTAFARACFALAVGKV